MFDLQSKIKRQIEIIGLCLNGAGPVRTFSLAYHFGVEELTIKRDLKDMRSYGIDIHSSKKEGVCLNSELNPDQIASCIIQYTRLNQPELVSDRTTALLIEKHGINALKNIVMLQFCIDRCLKSVIAYNKEGDGAEKKIVEPLLIYQSEDQWRLLVKEGDKIKQLLLSKIEHVERTQEKFEPIDKQKFEDLFLFSWKSWLGDERYKVKLQLSPTWASYLKHKMLIHNQKFTEHEDGSAIFEATVNSLNEITSWIVSRGEGIVVLEPEVLKRSVINLAKGTLKNYGMKEED